MTIRAKFTVSAITDRLYQGPGREIVLQPIYDTAIPEDQRFYDATPSGQMTMFINNPVALEQMPLGVTFYVDFTPVTDTTS